MSEFSDILEKVEPRMTEVDRLRQAATKARQTSFVVGGVLLAVGGLLCIPVGNAIPIIVALVLAIGAGIFISHGPRRDFRAGYKDKLVRGVVEALAPGLSYQPESGVSRSMFIESRLFPTRPDRYSTEDKLAGQIGSARVVMSEVHAEEKRTRRDSDGKTKTYYVDIFRGVFFTAELPKPIRSWTLVFPDAEGGALSGLGNLFKGLMPFGSKDEIRMSDPDFETHFRVQSGDPVEAHYLLNPDFMRRLVQLRNQWSSAIRLGFHGDLLFLALPSSQDFLEPGRGETSAHTEVSRIYEELSLLVGLVESLDLGDASAGEDS